MIGYVLEKKYRGVVGQLSRRTIETLRLWVRYPLEGINHSKVLYMFTYYSLARWSKKTEPLTKIRMKMNEFKRDLYKQYAYEYKMNNV